MEASAHSSPSRGGSILTETRLITHASASSGRRAPGAGWMSMPSCAPGPHRCRGGHREFWPEPSLPALHAASRPRASVPGEVLSPPGEKDPAQGTWDPSGKEAWKLVRVIGGVGYLCACVCVCDRQTHSLTHTPTHRVPARNLSEGLWKRKYSGAGEEASKEVGFLGKKA